MIDQTPWISVDEIKPHPDNPNEHTKEQIQKIARSIDELDWGRPIIISQDNYILIGHGAYEAATDLLHQKKVPYRRVEHIHSSSEAIALMLSDNKLAELSNWNYGKLQPLQHNLEITGFDTALTGFEDTELQEIETKVINKKKIIEDDFNHDLVTKDICKAGDIWQLGTHRLMCGDATNNKDVDLLMDGDSAHMVFTDPPYGLGGYGGRNHMELKGDDHKDITRFYECIPINIKERYIWGNYKNLMNNVKEVPRDVIVWKKNNFGLGKGYRGQYELCFYYGNFNGSDSDVWEVKKDINYLHPTQKPLELPARAIKNSSSVNDIVLDLFGGSGSTLLACEQLDRICYTMELDPHYCDVIINRWEEFTGQKAEIKKKKS